MISDEDFIIFLCFNKEILNNILNKHMILYYINIH